LTTARILTGYTPGLPDAVARLIADQMKDYAASIVIETGQVRAAVSRWRR
jgi:hypothetical protein